LRQFQIAIALAKTDSVPLAAAVSGLEEASEDPEAFRALCCRLREQHPEVSASTFVQWFLERIEVGQPQGVVPIFHDDFVASLGSNWVWQAPFADCSFTVQHGLEIQAVNGRDLWRFNLGAPRLLRLASGEFAIQTVCSPVSAETPAMGGLLLWKDRENFLRLDRGTRGIHEISFMGCLGNKDVIIGRGRLPFRRVHLRLERLSSRVNALCSADGAEWFSVGHTEFPAEDPVEVGLHAIGMIDRTLYPGAYPEGTAIRFESFAW
jgi:hypothetical protein